jgi:hypothetical protein
MYGTPDNHPKGGSIFSADRRGIAAGGDPQRSLFVDRRDGDGTAYYARSLVRQRMSANDPKRSCT